MSYLNLILAIPTLMMGIYNFIGAIEKISFSSKKLDQMKDSYGESHGRFLYILSYGISPILFSIVLFILTAFGISFFNYL